MDLAPQATSVLGHQPDQFRHLLLQQPKHYSIERVLNGRRDVKRIMDFQREDPDDE